MTRNGGGFLTEQFPDAYKVIWDFTGGTATSRHVPAVSRLTPLPTPSNGDTGY